MKFVGTALGDNVHNRAIVAPVFRHEIVGNDPELLGRIPGFN